MSAPPRADERQVRREAATWLVKHDRGLTAAEQDEFFQWLAADPRHGAWFSRHRGGWRRLDRIADWRPANSVEPNPDVLARPGRGRAWVRPALLAVAASLVVAFGAMELRRAGPRSAAPMPAPVARPEPGGFERRVLDDGSVVELNRGAEIEVNFSAAERRVALRQGEAMFTVAKNADRPFVVRARGVDVRAVGTAFNVRLESDSVEVLVTEGKVRVAPPAAAVTREESAPPLVVAGELAVVSLAAPAAPQIGRASAMDVARVQAWQPQLLDFSSTPLAQVLAEFNRRNRVQLVLDEPALAHVPIVASIRSDNIDGFVRLLASHARLRAERRGDYQIVLCTVK